MTCRKCGHGSDMHDRDFGGGRLGCSAVGGATPGRPNDACKCYDFEPRATEAVPS